MMTKFIVRRRYGNRGRHASARDERRWMGRLAAFLERQQMNITQQISDVGTSPFNSSRGRMVPDFRVGLRQVVIWNRWPEVMRRMIVHVQRRDEQPLQRIADERDEA